MTEIKIYIIDVDNEEYVIDSVVNPNLTLMDVLKEAKFPMGNCGGMALCASCHCYIESDFQLKSKTSDEEDMLDQLHNSDVNTSRLICQIPLTEKIDGIKIKIAKN